MTDPDRPLSRRRDSKDYVAQIVYLECAKGHRVGFVAKQRAGHGWERHGNPYLINQPLERIDGPNGATKVLAVCETCRNTGSTARPQIRWDRLQALLDEMENNQEAPRTIRVF